MAKNSKRPQKQQKAPKTSQVTEPNKGWYLVPTFLERYLEKPYFGFALGALYAVIILLIAIPNYQVGPYFSVVTDFYWDYVPSAEQFQQGNVNIDDYRGPGYPGMLGLVGFVIQDLFTAGMVIAAASAGVFLFLLYELISRLFRKDLALGVTLLTAVNPHFVKYAYNPGTDMFFAALVAGALFFLLKNQSINYRDLGIAALLTAVAYLTRYNGAFIVIFVPIAIGLFNVYHASIPDRVKSSAYFIALFFLFITPWGIHCYQQEGDFFYNKNYENVAYEVYAKGEMGWDEFWYGEGVDVNSMGETIMKDPAEFFGNVFYNIPSHFWGDMEKLIGWEVGWLTILGLALFVGLVARRAYMPNRQQWAFFLFFIMFFSVLLLVFHGPRFSLFLIPFYLLLGFQLFTFEQLRLDRLVSQFRWVPVVILALGIFTLSNAYEENSEQMDTGTAHLMEIKEQFDRQFTYEERQGMTVAARQPHIGYVLDLDFTRLPHEQDYNAIMEELREDEVDFLFMGLIELSQWRQLQFLANPNEAPEGLQPIVTLPQDRQTQRPPINLYRIVY